MAGTNRIWILRCLGVWGVTCLAWPTPATAQPDSTTRPPATSEPGLLDRLLLRLGAKRPAALDTFRGTQTSDTDGSMALWVVSTGGNGARRIGRAAGYRWPIFDPLGTRVAALRGGRVEVIALDGSAGAPVPVAATAPRVQLLLSWTERGIGFVDTERNVNILNPVTGEVVSVGAADMTTAGELLLSTRTCKTSYVAAEQFADLDGLAMPRTDVVVREQHRTASGGITWRGTNVTQRRSQRANMDPAFSQDCGKIVFVAPE